MTSASEKKGDQEFSSVDELMIEDGAPEPVDCWTDPVCPGWIVADFLKQNTKQQKHLSYAVIPSWGSAQVENFSLEKKTSGYQPKNLT